MPVPPHIQRIFFLSFWMCILWVETSGQSQYRFQEHPYFLLKEGFIDLFRISTTDQVLKREIKELKRWEDEVYVEVQGITSESEKYQEYFRVRDDGALVKLTEKGFEQIVFPAILEKGVAWPEIGTANVFEILDTNAQLVFPWGKVEDLLVVHKTRLKASEETPIETSYYQKGVGLVFRENALGVPKLTRIDPVTRKYNYAKVAECAELVGEELTLCSDFAFMDKLSGIMAAQKKKAVGKLTVKLTIGMAGSVEQVEFLHYEGWSPSWKNFIRKKLRKMRFIPAMFNGSPLRSTLIKSMRFEYGRNLDKFLLDDPKFY